VLFGVALAGVGGVLGGVLGVGSGRVGVVRRFLVAASFLVLDGFGVVGGSLLVTFSSFLRHCSGKNDALELARWGVERT